MAGRIRTIKPELLATERVARLTDAAYRVFLGCYSLTDDAGNCPAGPTYLGGQIFYCRPRSAIAIGKLLGELETSRLVDRYTADGAPYLAIIGWAEKGAPTYQRIDKPQPPRFPLPASVRSWNEIVDGSDLRSPISDRDSESERESDSDRARDSPGARAVSLSPLSVRWVRPSGGKAEAAIARRGDDIDAASSEAKWRRVRIGAGTLRADWDADLAEWLLSERSPKGAVRARHRHTATGELAIERRTARGVWDLFSRDANETNPSADMK